MPYPRSYWDAKRASREKRWQEENDEYAAKISRCVDVMQLIHAIQDIFSEPPIPRGFLQGGVHERKQ